MRIRKRVAGRSSSFWAALGGAVVSAVVLTPASQAAMLSCIPRNVLADGGFELATGSRPVSPDWTGTSTQFGSPLCTVATCGTASGTGPRSGLTWAWFGGVAGAAAETATLTQAILVPRGTIAFVYFELKRSAVSAPLTDVLNLKVDGFVRATQFESASPDADYQQIFVPLHDLADGAVHQFQLEYVKPAGGGLASFNVDDFRVDLGQIQDLADVGFENATGDPLDSPGWIESSVQFGSPLCTVALCGNAGGLAAPHGGTVWSWFGGFGGPASETSSLQGTLFFPRGGIGSLVTFFWLSAVTPPLSDTLTADIDGTEIWSISESLGAFPDYGVLVGNLEPFADGLPHELRLVYERPAGGGVAHFNVDDFQFQTFCVALFLDGFDTHNLSNWSASVP